MSYDVSDDYYAPVTSDFEESERACVTCGYLFDPSEEGPLCACCDETVRNPKEAAHLYAHEAGLNKAWLDAKQRSRERWFRRKADDRTRHEVKEVGL